MQHPGGRDRKPPSAGAGDQDGPAPREAYQLDADAVETIGRELQNALVAIIHRHPAKQAEILAVLMDLTCNLQQALAVAAEGRQA